MSYLSVDHLEVESDTLLPSQFFARLEQQAPALRERRLMLAILQDAVGCFTKHIHARDPKRRSLFEDAEQWLSSDDAGWPFSYANICDVLGMNTEYVREGLFAWRDQARKERAQRRPHLLQQSDSASQDGVAGVANSSEEGFCARCHLQPVRSGQSMCSSCRVAFKNYRERHGESISEVDFLIESPFKPKRRRPLGRA